MGEGESFLLVCLMALVKKWSRSYSRIVFPTRSPVYSLLEGRCMKSTPYPCLSEKSTNIWRNILLPLAGDTSPDQAVQGSDMLVPTSNTSVVPHQWESFGGFHTLE